MISTPVTISEDRVLNLHPRIHFHEEILAVLDQELHGSRASIAQPGKEADCVISHALPQVGGHDRRRALLHELLVVLLHGTVALPQVRPE